MRGLIPLLGLGLFVVGCAAGQVPEAKLTEAKADVKAAEAIHVARHPEAAMYLKLARNKINQAEKLIQGAKFDQAAFLLDQAQADAELATAMANAADAREEARLAGEEVRRLRGEIR